ncbi:hypothetical protein HDF18_21480 [Mucilaginibacter sp. X5P1]|uniref:hypothetical protein n=1 Tax=Mucilaginibacter sp. X5P1 TaxID=2723088 RepID=UPI0016207830|nr:hypothetical protein [Mucilaginibacter sp. X5P1]MBB6140185.1 TolA-binding protein [Mucilaginibacter sp. X5P1]
MKIKAFYLICLTLVLILLVTEGYSQTNTPPVTAATTPAVTPAAITTNNPNNLTRPSDDLGLPEVDAYVTNCYNVYDQTNQASTQLNAIEQQVIVTKKINMDNNGIEKQLTAFNLQLTTLNTDGQALVASSSDMTANVTNDLKGHPFKIPSALIRVRNSTKAVKLSLKNIHTMLTVTMVNINHRLHPLSAADSAKSKSDSTARGVANTGKTMKTAISITGINFSSFNSLSTELSNISSIKSINKKFKSSGTSTIDVVHYGTTDDLLNTVLSNCKDLVSGKNVGSSESGKISLAF